MKLKLSLSLFYCLVFIIQAYAQRQNVYFLKNSGKFVDQRDSADYVRIVKEPDSGSVLYNVTEYYLNGKVKMLGKTSTVEDLRLEGQCLEFYPSGKKKKIDFYSSGILSGDVYYYYPNGKLYAVIEHLNTRQGINYRYLIKTCNDSMGKALLADSNGHFISFNKNFNKILMEGEVKKGLKEGDWEIFCGTGKNENIYKVKYRFGLQVDGMPEPKIRFANRLTWNDSHEVPVVEGISNIARSTSQITPDYVDISPRFPGGEIALSSFAKSHIMYPGAAKKNGIKVTAYISFVVEKDGSLSDIKVEHDPGAGLGDEAARVMRLSPHWTPGIQNDVPIRVRYTVPVNFILEDK